jgi:hypothetical protein
MLQCNIMVHGIAMHNIKKIDSTCWSLDALLDKQRYAAARGWAAAQRLAAC